MEKENNVFWSSKLAFILAASGSAVGLGNIWRFPYLVGQHGGGTFIITYLLFSLIIGGSILLGELVLGRYLGTPILKDIKNKINNKFLSTSLTLLLIVAIIILSFYFVVSGWTLYYVYNSLANNISYGATSNTNYYSDVFSALLANPVELFIFTLIFIVITVAINYKGLIGGVEKANLYLLPLLFIMLIVIIFRSLTLEGAAEGVKFYFSFDASKITAPMLIDALGQSFFSLSLGMGIMLIYAAAIKKNYNLRESVASIVSIGAGVGLFSAMLIIPAVYAFGFKVNSGPSLTFITIPAIFSQVHFGVYFATLFFLIMAFAALTSTISLVETSLPLVEKYLKLSRRKSIALLSVVYVITALVQVLSFNMLQDVSIFGKNIFDFTNFLVNIAIVFGALLICIVVGWVLPLSTIKHEVTNENTSHFSLFSLWVIMIKYICPAIIIGIFITLIY
jgi:NSS family neurotransmitter:Na+ symporter